jgi:hypothetical protein
VDAEVGDLLPRVLVALQSRPVRALHDNYIIQTTPTRLVIINRIQMSKWNKTPAQPLSEEFLEN